MRKISSWMEDESNLKIHIILLTLFVSLLICFVNSYYIFSAFTSTEWIQIILLVGTSLLTVVIIAGCSKILCTQKRNLVDQTFDFTVWISSNFIFWSFILAAWNGRNWYYFWAIIFVLLFNVPFNIKCISSSKNNFLKYYFYISLMYFSTFGIIAVMGVYIDMDSMHWGTKLANSLQTIGQGYIISIALSMVPKLIQKDK